MRALASILFILISAAINAQETINSIKSYSAAIIGKLSDMVYIQDTAQFRNQIKSLSSGDLSLRSLITSKTFYLDLEPSEYQRNNLIRYDRATRSFSISHLINGDTYFDKPGYIQLDMILLKCPEGLILDTKNTGSSCIGLIEESIAFRIPYDSIAAKIEKNKTNLRLLFLFNYSSISPCKTTLSDPTPSSYYLLTDLKKVLVYNSSTGEIYSTYK